MSCAWTLLLWSMLNIRYTGHEIQRDKPHTGRLAGSLRSHASVRARDKAKQPRTRAENTARGEIYEPSGARGAVPGGARNGSQWMRDRWVWGSLRLRHFATCSRVRSNSLTRCARRPPSDSCSPPCPSLLAPSADSPLPSPPCPPVPPPPPLPRCRPAAAPPPRTAPAHRPR
ncbi:hypothetical protein EMIHUDRAFT_442972, partial [Emiliania huxleyi CCMP1516]|uniref:Secreted protein n=2 Tax=Emiliania huxleyi TaxID=2903 RepID=A0A0D3JXH1_EMIH1